MIVGVLATCHTQYRTTLQVFVTYLTDALYVHHLWFYKHQHDNRVRSKLFVACQRWWFQWPFRFVESEPPLKPSHIYSYLKCIVYDKLLKHRQSFPIALCNSYMRTKGCKQIFSVAPVHAWQLIVLYTLYFNIHRILYSTQYCVLYSTIFI